MCVCCVYFVSSSSELAMYCVTKLAQSTISMNSYCDWQNRMIIILLTQWQYTKRKDNNNKQPHQYKQQCLLLFNFCVPVCVCVFFYILFFIVNGNRDDCDVICRLIFSLILFWRWAERSITGSVLNHTPHKVNVFITIHFGHFIQLLRVHWE